MFKETIFILCCSAVSAGLWKPPQPPTTTTDPLNKCVPVPSCTPLDLRCYDPNYSSSFCSIVEPCVEHVWCGQIADTNAPEGLCRDLQESGVCGNYASVTHTCAPFDINCIASDLSLVTDTTYCNGLDLDIPGLCSTITGVSDLELSVHCLQLRYAYGGQICSFHGAI